MSVALAAVTAVALLFLFLLSSYSQWMFRSVSPRLDPSLHQLLATTGSRSLPAGDVPVASVVLYADTVIGTGYNVVYRDTSAGGHAEIEAISSAMKRIGPEAFSRLDRDSLVLITTFEPCPMCRGAILEYRIRHVRFFKEKPLSTLLREDLRMMDYYLSRRRGGPADLQDSLFMMHPGYNRTR